MRELESLLEDWTSLKKEYHELEVGLAMNYICLFVANKWCSFEEKHKVYLDKLGELEKIQQNEIRNLKEHDKKFSSFKGSLKRLTPQL